MTRLAYEQTTATMIVNAIDILRHRDFWLAFGLYGAYYVSRMYLFEMWRARAVAANFRGPGLISQFGLAAVLTVLVLAMTPLLLGLSERFDVRYLRLIPFEVRVEIIVICALFTLSLMATERFGLFSGLMSLFQACAVFAMAASTLSQERAFLMPEWQIAVTIAATGLTITMLPGLAAAVAARGDNGHRRRIATGFAKTAAALLAVLPLTLYAGWMQAANGL